MPTAKATPQACRESGITEQAYYSWRKEDGTASLDDRDFGAILRLTQRKVVFSGAVAQANEAPHAGYFGVFSG